jgi:hypothetical protein
VPGHPHLLTEVFDLIQQNLKGKNLAMLSLDCFTDFVEVGELVPLLVGLEGFFLLGFQAVSDEVQSGFSDVLVLDVAFQEILNMLPALRFRVKYFKGVAVKIITF